MTTKEAINYLDNLRKAVLTVQGQSGPQAVSGADHDIWRDAVNVLKCEHGGADKIGSEPAKKK